MGLPYYRPRGLVKESRASRVVITQVDTDSGVQAETFSGDVDQLDGCDYYEPPGLAITPAAATEGVRLPGNPDPMILARGTRHSSTPTPPAGGAVLYGPNGGYAYFDSNGDMICEPASGRTIKLGSGATKAVAVDLDLCVGTALARTWMSQVEQYINGLVPGTITPLSTTFSSTAIAYINASTTKATAE